MRLKNVSGLELALSKSEVAITTAELQRIQVLLDACMIYAPFSGMVTEKLVQAYEFVNIGDPLLEVVDTTSLEVEMVVPSRWLARLTLGTPFQITLDEVNTPIKARIARVVGSIDPVSQTARVIGVLQDHPPDLLPGMSGEVVFLDATTSAP